MTLAADAPAVTDWATAVTAVVALVLSIFAFAVSIWSAISGHRSAKAAEKAADIAEKSMAVSAQSAKAAEVSARAAEKSADADGQLALVELSRNHQELAPVLIADMFKGVPHPVHDTDGLWFTFSLPRAYRVYAYVISKVGESMPVSVDPLTLVPAGMKARVYVGPMELLPETLELRFFPPAEIDLVDQWSCRCGAEVNADKDSAGHWVIRRRVEKPEGYLGKEDVLF
jgi:hypothetical protein